MTPVKSPTSSASANLINGTQASPQQPWSSWFADKLSFAARFSNVFLYASVVTTVFALFAIQRGNGNTAWAITYGASSALFNYPMAIAFNETLVSDFFKGLGSKPLSFKIAFAMGLMLALETTVGGLAVAESAVNKIGKDLPSAAHFLIFYSIFTFCLNTFATRMVGAAGFLHGIYTDLSNFMYRRFTDKGIYFDLKDDLDRYATQLENNMILGAVSQETYLRHFYQTMSEQNLSPNKTALEHMKSVVYGLSVNLPGVLAFFLLPMWLGLSQSGWKEANRLFGTKGLEQINALVYSSAVSSWLFYIRGSRMFADNAIRFHTGFTERAANFANWLFSSDCLKAGATYLTLAAGWGAIVFSSGCSGSGFAVVIHDDLHPVNGTFPTNSTSPYPGFGTAAEGFFNIVPLEWLFRHVIAPMGGYSALATAGVAINGGSFLKFIADCWDIQKKESCSFPRACAIKMLAMRGQKPVVAVEEVHAAETAHSLNRDDREAVLTPQATTVVTIPTVPTAAEFKAFRLAVDEAIRTKDFSRLPSPTAVKDERETWAVKTHCGLFTRRADLSSADGLSDRLIPGVR